MLLTMGNKIFEIDTFGEKPFSMVEKAEPAKEEPTKDVEPKDGVDPIEAKDNPPAPIEKEKAEEPAKPVEKTEPVEAKKEKPKDKKPNVYSTFAKLLKSDGLFSDDIEIPEDVDLNFIKDTIRNSVVEPERERVRTEVTEQVVGDLRAQGINDHHLNLALALASGEAPETVSELGRIKSYSELSLDTLSERDDYEDKAREVIASMYSDRGFKKTEVDRMLKSAVDDDDLDRLLEEEAIPYHKQKYEAEVKSIRERKEAEIRQQREAQDRTVKTIERVVQTKKIKDQELSDDVAANLKHAIYTPSEEVQTEDGKKFQITKLQRFLHDFETDVEFKLLVFSKFAFDDFEKAKVKQDLRSEIEEELLAGLEATDALKGDYEAQKKAQEKRSPNNVKSFEIDLAEGTFNPMKI